jgi:hypothetical protein
MTQFATINLQTLNFIRASDGKGNSTPYIWPAILPIDNNGVGLTIPALANVVIANGMHAGDTASIPQSVGQLIAQIGDGFQALIVVVALWDQSQSPDNVVEAGFQAFGSELRAAVQDNLAGLSDPSQRDAAVTAIKKRVNDKVSSAIENALSFFQKGEIFLGLLHLDSNIGSDFQSLQKLVPTAITLDIVQSAGTAASEYTISGNLQLSPTGIAFPAILGCGNLPVGQPSDIPAPLTITNIGTTAATVSIPASPHFPQTNFVWDGSGNHTINPGASLTLDVTFKPSTIGFVERQLRFTSNAAGSPHTVDLHGKGVKGLPQ